MNLKLKQGLPPKAHDISEYVVSVREYKDGDSVVLEVFAAVGAVVDEELIVHGKTELRGVDAGKVGKAGRLEGVRAQGGQGKGEDIDEFPA